MRHHEDSRVRAWSNDNYRHPRHGRARRYLLSFLIGIAAVYIVLFVSLPYFIFMPGTAEEIKPMVSIQQQADVEKGALMLTTVRVSSTNILNYIIASLHPYREIYPKKSVFQNGETESEYSQRQQYVMMTSQSSAIQAAYKKAGVPYGIRNEGVVVLRTSPGMPGEKVLRVGDTLLRIDGQEIKASSYLLDYLRNKKAGDTVSLTFKRDQEERTEALVLAAFPLVPGETTPRVGIGITPADKQSIKADNPAQQVSIRAGEIGGPSAGLMFSLEIYNQLVPEDITRGYRIAGTGTIDEEGKVGYIGGIQHKIIAAERAGAEMFFAPKDIVLDHGVPVNNYSDAVARAKQINSDMKIIAVETMDDALRYLSSLPPKSP